MSSSDGSSIDSVKKSFSSISFSSNSIPAEAKMLSYVNTGQLKRTPMAIASDVRASISEIVPLCSQISFE